MGLASPACKHSHPQGPSTQKTQCSQLAGFTGMKTNKGKEAMLAVFLQTPASLCDLQIVVWSLHSLILPLVQWAQRTGIFRKYASVGYSLVRSLAAVPRSQRGRGKGTGHRHTQYWWIHLSSVACCMGTTVIHLWGPFLRRES